MMQGFDATVSQSRACWRQLLVAVGLLALATTASGATQYPHNPCAQNRHLYVGGQGLQRFSPNSKKPDWSVLPGIATYEPVCTAAGIFIGSSDGLYAIDAQSGALRWSWGRGRIVYSPAVDGRAVYVTGLTGRVRKLDAGNGALVWETQLDGWLYPPAVVGDRIIVGGKAGMLSALDANDGHIRWQRAVGHELVYRPVAATPDRVIVATYAAELRTYASDSGALLWRHRLPSTPYSPLVDGVQVIVGDQDGRVHALSLASGRQLWQRQLQGTIRATPSAGGDGRHVWIATDLGQLAMLDGQSGAIIWQTQLARPLLHSPLPMAARIYVTTEQHTLISNDVTIPAQTGRRRP